MIYILTVHWENTKWVDLQLKYIKKHITAPHKKFAFLNIPTNQYDTYFEYHSHENIKRHASKLNILADLACMDSKNDDDILIFLDGDAFPVGDVVSYINTYLERYPLIAVQRLENLGDIQPHPCFCVTTTSYWKKIKGNWNPGGAFWNDKNGNKITDLGGQVLKKLEDLKENWKPMLRSNKNNLHSLYYGVYENLIYHHGAGFRNPATRTDLNEANKKRVKVFIYKLLGKILPHHINKKYFRPMNSIVEKNKKESEKVYNFISKHENFLNYFSDANKFLKLKEFLKGKTQ